ncbi:MAG: hypothetical protein IJC88_02060 [Oscillospiraceae bacterium]|nr:hypothetical protein [Oscillospiraceae bacterium]
MKGSLLENNLPACDPNAVWEDGGVSYTLCTKRYSHWKYKSETELEFLSETKIATCDTWNPFIRRFESKKTAIIIMDPWINTPSDFGNEYFGRVTDEKILPLVRAAQKSGHQIIVLSDDPSGPYNSKIPQELQEMVDDGRATLFVHGKTSLEDFKNYALQHGIEKFVYTGFCTNICILFRELGLPNIVRLRIGEAYLIPDCAAAMEHGDTWDSQIVHQSAALLISQAQALLIEYEDIMNAITK